MKFNKSRKLAAIFMSVLLSWMGLAATTASAAMVDTSVTISEYSLAEDKAALKSALDRDDVRERLLDLGISIDDVDTRIDALTADELASLKANMDDMPAGAGAVGLLAFVVLVFFITDVLGITDIFPFVNAAN
ncbi:PA2779 family protein [Spongiibacter sp. UBA1325]|uniref:PA2779 family protein n=1 Tax=Spongiibacter sp. UBA1325 TaxID=1947543 RepID=UPI00257D7C22|nr:PA2779 family protein [Spongiibacter sp. UBA1325]|tara:strand:- start:6310 stop:6708 length:399 start_codon:yes stop_codon:yes gene_type:complete